VTILDLIEEALGEIGVLAAGDTATAEDADLGLRKLNRLFDNWSAERAAVYAQAFNTYVLTTNLSPHTIGPTAATWSATQRPVTIEAAGLVLTTPTPDVRIPITPRDADWWAAQPVKALTGTVPTDLYYQPDWPNGKLFFWPVPTVAYSVELSTRVLLAQVALTDTFTLPPGYRDAITLSLAESLLAVFPTGEIAALIVGQAAKARARIFGVNDRAPRIATQDVGMPGGGGGSFNYLTREWTR
jgi:hypothetical protein